jgi:hypothetical protein
MFRTILLACCLVAFSRACYSLPVNQSNDEMAVINQIDDGVKSDWDDLKIGWSANIFDDNTFVRMPRTEDEAIDQGWTKERNCSSELPGIRYMLNGDRAVMLLYDVRGNIVGMSAGIPKGLAYIPTGNTRRLFKDEGDFYSISAYFTDPDTVCSDTKAVTRITGDRLIFKSSVLKISVPLEQGNLTSIWTPGQCFNSMGMHYWYDINGQVNKNTLQTDFLPICVLYNQGRLAVSAYFLSCLLTYSFCK